MITVLNIIDTGGLGGAETVFLQTATGLDPARFCSIAIVGSDGWLAKKIRANGGEPLAISAKGSFHVGYLRSLVKIVRERGVDVIAAHLYGSAIYASLAGLICRVPVVSILHGQSDVDSQARLARLKSAIVRVGSSRIVFVSQNLQQDLQARLSLSGAKCVVIPNGVDTLVFRPGHDQSVRHELGLSEDTILVGAIGNIRAPKAYDVLLKAASILLKRSNRFHFVIAGEGSGKLYEQLIALRQQLGIENNTTFLGLRSDVVTLLHNLDVFTLSSRTEGFSIACIEAMACGVPVVATRSGGPQQIIDEHSGLLVAPDSPEALADAIYRMAFTEHLAQSVTESALRRVKDQFSLCSMLFAYEELFASLAAGPVVKSAA